MDCSLPGSSVHGDSSGRNTGVGLPYPLPGDLLNPGVKSRSPALQADSLLCEPPGWQDPVSRDRAQRHPHLQASALGPATPYGWPWVWDAGKGAFLSRGHACKGSPVKSLSLITNTRVCLENSINLFDYQKSWGLESSKKRKQDLLEKAWIRHQEAWVPVLSSPFTSGVTSGKSFSEPPWLHL